MSADAVRLLTDLATRLTDRATEEAHRADDATLDGTDRNIAAIAAMACKAVAEELIAALQNGGKPDAN